MRAINETQKRVKKQMADKLEVETLEYKNTLYVEVDHVDEKILKRKNRNKSWEYGYNEEYDFVCISKDGTVGGFLLIQGLVIGLPAAPKKVHRRSENDKEQYWEIEPSPDDKMFFKLNKLDSGQHYINQAPQAARDLFDPFIEEEWERREKGFWFKINGTPTYITGAYYFYLRWAKIDIGKPEYRDSNRIFFHFVEACMADERCYGMAYLKNRRSGFSFMASSLLVNSATQESDSQYGIVSKTGADAKSMFVNKVVPISFNLPFFFRPIQSGEKRPKTELLYQIPSTKMTKKKMIELSIEDDIDDYIGLDTKIDHKSTNENSYDGEKLKILVEDEAAKWEKGNNIENHWSVVRTCLRVGVDIIGKVLMGTTCNKMKDGGEGFKKLYEESDLRKIKRNSVTGQTSTGMYSLFIPMEWNVEGKMDLYGYPVFNTPEEPVMGNKGKLIKVGVIEEWEAEISGLKNRPAQQNEHYRQYPRTEAHAFRDEITNSLFNIAKIYEQVDHNDTIKIERDLKRGSFQWRDGIKDTEVVFRKNEDGRFLIDWEPPENIRNNVIEKHGIKYPGNMDMGAFGCDSYDISGTVDTYSASNGALHGLTSFNMFPEVPSNRFFLQYVARPQTAEIFFEEVLMALVYYGMPALIENNKPRLLYHLKNRGYRGFSMNRPDRYKVDLSVTELELGGIPNNSEDIKQTHAASIETYIEEYVGFNQDTGDMGYMPFNRTLNEWTRFDVSNRTSFDASISSGLAVMANRRHLMLPTRERKNISISVPISRYNNNGNHSELIR